MSADSRSLKPRVRLDILVYFADEFLHIIKATCHHTREIEIEGRRLVLFLFEIVDFKAAVRWNTARQVSTRLLQRN